MHVRVISNSMAGAFQDRFAYKTVMQVDTKSRQVEIELESAELRSDQAPSIPLKPETQGWSTTMLL